MTYLFSLKRHRRFFTALIATFLLAGCGSLLDTGQDANPDTIFDLEPVQSMASGEKEGTLFISKPSFPAYLETVKIVVKPGGQEIQYLAGARWSDLGPSLFSRHIAVSLGNTSTYHILSARQGARPHEMELVIDIRDFSTHIGLGGNPSAVIDFEATLLVAKTNKIVAHSNFSRSISAGENSKAAIAGAFQSAMDSLAGELQGWLSSNR